MHSWLSGEITMLLFRKKQPLHHQQRQAREARFCQPVASCWLFSRQSIQLFFFFFNREILFALFPWNNVTFQNEQGNCILWTMTYIGYQIVCTNPFSAALQSEVCYMRPARQDAKRFVFCSYAQLIILLFQSKLFPW